MKFTLKDLNNAVEKNIISNDQYNSLIDYKKTNSNRGSNFLYYAGSLLVISAMTWLMASSWDSFGGIGIFALSIIYMLAFSIFGRKLFTKSEYKIPAGLLFTIVICITPLAIFGLLKHLGIWDTDTNYGDFYIWIKGKWVILEVATIVVGLIIFKFIKFPFIIAPIAFALWFLSMDIVPILFQDEYFSWTERKYVSLIFGIISILIGYVVHRKSDASFAFWIYFFGLLTLVSSLSIFYNDDILMFVIFFLVNTVFIFLSIILEQKVFLVYGIIGLMEFVGRLSFEIFKDSPILPFVYTAIGILLIIIGIQVQKNKWGVDIVRKLPSWMKVIKP